MTIAVKICGLRDEIALKAAIKGGAKFIGFVFLPFSKNAVTADEAEKLAIHVPLQVTKTGLFVDASDEDIRAVTGKVSLDLIQLHGTETPARVAQIRILTARPVMKALRMRTSDDLKAVAAYEKVADHFLFDSRIGNEPSGGPIDWALLKGRTFAKPWMLAGGLNAQNLAEAVRCSGASAVDVSSSVEDHPGHKSPEKIREFLQVAGRL
jgi:phosphoribosylanthranilate isomerase